MVRRVGLLLLLVLVLLLARTRLNSHSQSQSLAHTVTIMKPTDSAELRLDNRVDDVVCSLCHNSMTSKDEDMRIIDVTDEVAGYKRRIEILEYELRFQHQCIKDANIRLQKFQEIRDQMIAVKEEEAQLAMARADDLANAVNTLEGCLRELNDERIPELEARLNESMANADTLEQRLQMQKVENLEKETEFNTKILDKDSELEDARALIDELQLCLQRMQEVPPDMGEIESDGSSLAPPHVQCAEFSIADGVCQYCHRRKLDVQDWPYHFQNCPESRRWHSLDTLKSLPADLNLPLPRGS